MTPEIEALLGCVRRQAGTSSSEEPVFDPHIDWFRLVRLADQHRVVPIVYAALGANWPGPIAALERLRGDAAGISLKSIALAREAVRLAALIEAAGIPVIVIKGPVLASVAYGNPGLRQFGDIDLLVRPGDVAAAAELLLTDGYEAHNHGGLRDFEQLSARQEQFCKPRQPGFVELHWRLMPSFFDYGPDQSDIWRRALRVPLAGSDVLTLCGRDSLFFLCAHGAKHGWPALQSICDVAASMRGRVDWAAVIADARAAGGLRILLLGMRLVHEILGCEAPANVLRMALDDRAVSAGAMRVRARLLSGDPNVTLLDEAIFQFRMTEGFRRRLRYLSERGLKPTVNDRNFVRLPRPLDSLYFVIRPIRLLLDALKTH
jgi:hypothetical protein